MARTREAGELQDSSVRSVLDRPGLADLSAISDGGRTREASELGQQDLSVRPVVDRPGVADVGSISDSRTESGSGTRDAESPRPQAPALSRDFSQELIDKACSARLLDFGAVGEEHSFDVRSGEMDVAKSISYLALVAYLSPTARSTSGVRVADKLQQQLHNVVQAGREPAPDGGMNGFWSYNELGLAIALARRTPAVWMLFGADDRDRLDWLMKALTVQSAYGTLAESFPSHGLNNTVYTWMGHSFPNHWIGWYAQMVYAIDYFDGVAGLNRFLRGFSFDALLAKARAFGWSRMTSSRSLGGAYPGTPSTIKDILERGGTDARGKKVASVKQDFYTQVDYRARKEQRVNATRRTNDPWRMFYDMTKYYMFAGKVVNETTVGGYSCGLLDRSKSSPHLSRMCQAAEWATHLCPELYSPRSNGHYVSSGMGMYMPWAGFMRARGYWRAGDEGQELEELIRCGYEDTEHKVSIGWSGRNNDGREEIWTKDAFFSDFWGGKWIRDLFGVLVVRK